MEKRGLGKGLGALIPEKTSSGNSYISIPESIQHGVINLEIDKIKASKYQPRGDFDKASIEELTASIREKGIIQPILVREKDGYYELIAGERRFRAAQNLCLKEIPAIIKNVSDLDSLELSIIENVQREDLNPIDQAKAFNRLLEEFNMTHEEIGFTIGKDRATVSNILRLLKLPQKIQEFVSHGTISMGHARAILSLHSEEEQMRLCTKVIKDCISVRDTERYAKRMSSLPKTKVCENDPNLMFLEEELRELFGTKVRIIKHGKRGKVEIEFYSDNDLERVVTILKSRS